MSFWLFTILVFVMDVGTAIPIAIKTNTLKSVYIKKPSIILGDMIIIPLIGGYILNYFLASGRQITEIFSTPFMLFISFIAILLALISGLRFKTTNPWYWPHTLFYMFFAFWLLLFLIGKFDLSSVAWWLVLLGIGTHLYLGKKYPKVFPKIK